MKKVLSIVMTLAILLGCFGYSAFAKADEQPQTTPAQIRDKILAKRNKNWQEYKEFDEYISQKIDENGGEYWEDEESGSIYIRLDTSNYPDYNLTDEQLEYDTETLLDAVLSTNCMSNILITLSSVDEETYSNIASYSNGLRELELREDIGTVLVKRYQEEYLKSLNPDYKSTDFLQIDFMLDQKIYNIWLNSNEQNIVEYIKNCLHYPDSAMLKMINSAVSYAFTISGIGYNPNGTVITAGNNNVPVYSAASDLPAYLITLFKFNH